MVQCYYKNDDNPNLIRSINSGVCMGSGSAAGFYSCCFPWDQCLPDGLCYANTSSTYYTSLCTDQTLQDSACQKACGGLYRTGLVYDHTANLWACCDESDPTCSTSTNATFSDPNPDTLRQHTMVIVDFIPTTTAASTTASASTTVTSDLSSAASTTSPTSAGATSSPTTATSNPSSASTALSPTATQHNSESSSPNTGAIVGISVGVTVAVIALIAGIVFWILQRRKQKRMLPADTSNLLRAYRGTVEKHGAEVVEAPGSYDQHTWQRKPSMPGRNDGVYELG